MMNTPTADDVLARLGLQTRTTARDYLFPALGIFGLGILVGAGIVVISTPSMREQLRDRLRRGASRVREVTEQARERMEDVGEQIKERVSGGNGRGRQTESSMNP
jgi:hypothetical protein